MYSYSENIYIDICKADCFGKPATLEEERATKQMGLHKPDPKAAKKSCSYTQNSTWPHIVSRDTFSVCVCNSKASEWQLNKKPHKNTDVTSMRSHEGKWKNSTAFQISLEGLCASVSYRMWHFLGSSGWLGICFQIPQHHLQLSVALWQIYLQLSSIHRM